MCKGFCLHGRLSTVCIQCPQGPEERVRSPGVINASELLCVCWESSYGPLQESSLQPRETLSGFVIQVGLTLVIPSPPPYTGITAELQSGVALASPSRNPSGSQTTQATQPYLKSLSLLLA